MISAKKKLGMSAAAVPERQSARSSSCRSGEPLELLHARLLALRAPALLFMLFALLQAQSLLGDDRLARGIDPVSFKPAPGDSFITVESAHPMPAGQYRIDLLADGSFGLMTLLHGDDKVGDLLRRRMDLHLLLSMGLPGRLELAADLPMTVHQSHGFALLDEQGLDLDAPASSGAGDTRLSLKVPFPLREQGRDHADTPSTAGDWSAALVAEIRLPTGESEAFLGERGVMLAPRAVVEWQGSTPWRLAGTLGYRWRQQPGRFLNLYVGDEIHAGLAASRALPPISGLAGWDVFGEMLMATQARAPFAYRSPAYKTPLEGIVGVRAALKGGLEGRLAVGRGASFEPSFGRPGLRLSASLGYAWPTRPSDRPPATAFRTERITCEHASSEQDAAPRPAVTRAPRCRPVPCEPVPCAPVTCQPVPCEPRPAEPAPPVEPAIVRVEQLPDVPEGPPWAVFEDGRIQLRGNVRFDLGQASLQADSFPVLDDVAEVLTSNPGIRRVRIDGHTDSIGSAEMNLALSKRRAESVVRYLVERGIDAARVSAEGFGQTRPVATNDTPAGRARNRRVEITILEQD